MVGERKGVRVTTKVIGVTVLLRFIKQMPLRNQLA